MNQTKDIVASIDRHVTDILTSSNPNRHAEEQHKSMSTSSTPPCFGDSKRLPKIWVVTLRGVLKISNVTVNFVHLLGRQNTSHEISRSSIKVSSLKTYGPMTSPIKISLSGTGRTIVSSTKVCSDETEELSDSSTIAWANEAGESSDSSTIAWADEAEEECLSLPQRMVLTRFSTSESSSSSLYSSTIAEGKEHVRAEKEKKKKKREKLGRQKSGCLTEVVVNFLPL
jgi:hypothetical protein